MKLILGVVADAANRAFGDKLNILGIFHTIGSAQFPVTHPHMALALEFKASPTDKGRNFNWQVRLVGPDGQRVLDLGGELAINRDAPALTPIVPMDINLHNVAFPVAGNYNFEILLDGELKGEVPLEVVKMPA